MAKGLVIVLLLISSGAAAQPGLLLAEDKYTFGTVKRGDTLQHPFVISNSGDQPLLIREAEVACSCTTVDFPKQPVLPGQSATVTVTFKTASVYGRQDRSVLLHSNDPKGPAKIRFKANVPKD